MRRLLMLLTLTLTLFGAATPAMAATTDTSPATITFTAAPGKTPSTPTPAPGKHPAIQPNHAVPPRQPKLPQTGEAVALGLVGLGIGLIGVLAWLRRKEVAPDEEVAQ